MTAREERFLKLGWELLEHKCRYYILIQPIINDYAYDLLEKEYDSLALKLGRPQYVSDMVEFDMNRPSCQLVYKNLTWKPKTKRRKKKVLDAAGEAR